MRNLKKVLSLVLCLAVMLSVMVVGAGAAFSDQDKIENTEAVDACSALNIINGYEDGAFHPERNIKRAEVTKMICVALNGGEEPNTSTNAKPTFTDVRGTIYAWAEGYIESCVAQGIVDGVGGTRFSPAGNVTAAQLAKMLLVSLGYNAKAEQFTGNAWETNVNVRAAQKGLYDGLAKLDTSAAVTRDQAAQMVWNAMQAYEVEYKDGVLQDKVVGSTNDKITLLRDKYDAWVYVGTLTEVDSTNMTISMNAADRAASDPKPEDKIDEVKFTKVGQDYSALMGQKVKVLFKNGKTNDVIGAYATDDNTVYAVPANGTEKDGDKVKFNGNSYSVELVNGGIKTYVDGQPSSVTTLAQLDANDLNPNLYTFVDTDDNNKLDTLIVKTYNVAQVTYAASDKIIANGKTYKTADENIAKDLKKDDWVVITENLYKDQKDIVKADVQTAKLDALRDNGNGSVHFDGKADVSATWNEYKIGDTWYKGGDKVQGNLSENDLNTVKAGEKVDYVAVNGIMFYVKKSSGDVVGKVDDVALVVNKGTTGINDEVKLAFFDGTSKTVKFDNDSPVKWDALKTGTVYEYDVSGDEYSFGYDDDNNSLTPAKNLRTSKEYYGDMTYMGEKTTSGTNAFDKVGTYNIDDNAEVLLFLPKDKATVGGSETGNDFKKISGKQFKALAAGKVINASSFYAFYGDMNGIDRVGALSVAVSDLGDIVQTWSNYGYIVTKPAKIDNKTIEYTFWNGAENVTVRESKSNFVDRDKGTVIGYDTLTEKDGVKVIDDVDKVDNITFTAVTSVNSKGDTAIFAVAPAGAGSNTELDKVSSSNVFYVDTDEKDLEIGVKDGEIKEAQKSEGKYLANALVIGNNDEIELLIIDQGEYLDNDIYTVSGTDVIDGENANAATVQIGAISDVAVGETVNMEVVITTKNVDKDTAVAVSLEQADGLTATATNIDKDGKAVVTIKGTPKKDGQATLKVTVGGNSAVTKDFTINKAASNVVLKTNYNTTDNATFGTTKTYTGTVGYQNAWMLTPDVKVVDNQGTDKSADFDISDSSLALITDNNAGAQTFTVKTKTTTKVGDYKIVVTLGDQKTEQAIKVVTAVVAAPTVNLTKITNGQNPTQAQATCSSTGVNSGNVVTEWYKAADTTGTKLGDSETVATGDTVSVKVILTATEGYTFTGGSYDAVQLFGQTAAATIAPDGTTLTLVVNNQTV